MSAINSNYPQPVTVNGFSCKNCTEVDEAKKHIDPAHPKSGPYDVNAASDPTRHGAAVKLGGSLAALDKTGSPPSTTSSTTNPYQPGRSLDIAA